MNNGLIYTNQEMIIYQLIAMMKLAIRQIWSSINFMELLKDKN